MTGTMGLWDTVTAASTTYYVSTSDILNITNTGTLITYVPVAPPTYAVQWQPPVAAPPAPPRGFNIYLNAFDLLAEFTKEANLAGVRQGQFRTLPVDLFVTWLILKSAEFDGVEPPEGTPKALPFPKRARCLDCGRFLSAGNERLSFHYCGAGCLERRRGKLG